jgi:tetratricopeptide (TPR) repeat protein
VTAIAERLNQAFQAQSRGELQSAAETYRAILQDEPNNVNALHLLGLAYLNTGRIPEAEELISRAIEHNPAVAELHNNRGLCRISLGRWGEAESDLREAIRLQPNFADAFNNLGLLFSRAGRFADAEAAFIRAIRLKPEFAAAFHNLATTVLKLGRAANAAGFCRRALALRPNYAEAETTLGLALLELGNHDEAEASFRRALAIKPLALTWLSLGRLLRGSGRRTAAEHCLRASLELAENAHEALQELGFTLLELGKLGEAEGVARQALRLGFDSSESHRLLGSLWRDRGQFQEAEACYVQAIQRDPANAAAHRDLAELHLLTGRWRSGWKGYEWRWRCRDATRIPFEQPAWDGQPLEGKTILLWAEPALENLLQFVRYTRLIQARGAQVILRVPADLKSLLGSQQLGIDRLVGEDQPLPQFDTHAPLSHLPGILGTTLDTVPAEVPYVPCLELDTATWLFWQERLDRFPGERVGILWSSDGMPESFDRHSLPPAAWESLARISGISLISLHKNVRSSELPHGVAHLGSDYERATWTDMVAVLAGLDLVIAVDTSLVHLAGALGVPVWLALAFTPDWRWLLNREDSPWYSTMRLFRQPQPGDWQAVAQRLAFELESWARAAAHGTARKRRPHEFEFTGAIMLDNL